MHLPRLRLNDVKNFCDTSSLQPLNRLAPAMQDVCPVSESVAQTTLYLFPILRFP